MPLLLLVFIVLAFLIGWWAFLPVLAVLMVVYGLRSLGGEVQKLKREYRRARPAKGAPNAAGGLTDEERRRRQRRRMQGVKRPGSPDYVKDV